MEITKELLADPVQFAQWVTETYVVPTYELEMASLGPSAAETATWEISLQEVALCRFEFPLMAAAGVTVTVTKNLTFEYYCTFISALCGRLAGVLYGHYGSVLVNDAKRSIEQYVAHLESQNIQGFASYYTDRIFGDNAHKADIFEAKLWQRAMDVLLQTMAASRESIVTLLGGEV